MLQNCTKTSEAARTLPPLPAVVLVEVVQNRPPDFPVVVVPIGGLRGGGGDGLLLLAAIVVLVPLVGLADGHNHLEKFGGAGVHFNFETV